MALRSPELRQAYETVRQDKAAQRKARKAESIKHVQAWAKSTLAHAKDKRQLDKPFLAFVRRQPCAAAHLGGCGGRVEAAHIRYSCVAAGSHNPGLQAKNHDRFANPLCFNHHQHDQHKRRERDFWDAVGVDAYEHAARLYARFLTGDGAAADDGTTLQRVSAQGDGLAHDRSARAANKSLPPRPETIGERDR